jgi:hypothetical protein
MQRCAVAAGLLQPRTSKRVVLFVGEQDAATG